MQFRKKPVIIEAVQFLGDISIHPALLREPGDNQPAFIETLEGRMTANPGDWIITGVKGEHYPCKPDIFEATYETASVLNLTNPVAETKAARLVIRGMVEDLSASQRKSRSRSLAVTKLEEASMWLGKDLQELNEPNPYPNSHDPGNPAIDPSAPEACKLPSA
jgi:hypothetical protein